MVTMTETVSSQELWQEAGPLPVKRGEIGYVEGIYAQMETGPSTSRVELVLPPRHPADRESSEATPDNQPLSPPNPPGLANNNSNPSSPSPSNSKEQNSACSYGGLQLTTLSIFFVQVLLYSGTIVGWVLSVITLQKATSGEGVGGPTFTIFIHIIFVVAVLAQSIFLERRIWRLRAERYRYLHPGEILPTSRNRGTLPNSAIAFAPWNRPPLPTYAAALAQSGAGTGDVEDHIIAAPPPPAYGNTRGSTLLLAGYLRDSLRAQRPVSEQSQMSSPIDRPLSYMSRDEQWEEIQNADRALRLEETLARLESSNARS